MPRTKFDFKRKPFVKPVVVQPCSNCGVVHDFVWITLPDESTLCFKCFENLHPASAAINRFKPANSQLEIPIWEKETS